MSDNKEPSRMLAYYADLYELGGAVLDKQGYERHASAPSQEQQPDDPFSVPQDLRAIAAQAIQSDREAACENGTTECTQQTQLVPEQIVLRGSGSYRTSGSYRLSSFVSSGSYRVSSDIVFRSRHVSAQDLGGYGLHLI